VLDRDLVAADDHVVVLAVTDTFTALGQHGEVVVSNCGMDRGEDGVVSSAFATLQLSAGRHFMQVSKWLGHSTFTLTLDIYGDCAARRRLDEAADRMARELLGIATGAESEAVKLAAVRDALDRAGLSAKQSVELSAKRPEPWEEMMMDFARTSRERQDALEQLARRGEPPAPLSPAPARPDIVDAELVPPQEARDHRPRGAVDGADRPDTADVPTDKSATSPAPAPPPPRELNQDEAAALLRESRLRTGQIRRKARNRPTR
jgi:hypothetical protein